jgi:hypothetical protein
MKHANEMASAGMIYISSFMTIGSGIQVILLPQKFERLQCRLPIGKGFKKLPLRWPQVA